MFGAQPLYAQTGGSCTPPRTYSIGMVDARFSLASSTLRSALSDAETVWEGPAKKDIFMARERGGQITINLIYDTRQESSNALRAQSARLDVIKSVLTILQASHKQALEEVKTDVASNTVQFAAYARDMDTFNADVTHTNTAGGADSAQYAQFQIRKDALQVRFIGLKEIETTLNGKITTLNTIASLLNQVVAALNAYVTRLNATAQTSGEFEEGVYSRRGSIEKIDIYEFSDKFQLTRLLAHELGHALGMEHVKNDDAIMYKINKGTSLSATASDLAEYTRFCK